MKGWMCCFCSLFLLLVACENDIIEDVPKETPAYLGYFKGKLNGDRVSIRNKSNRELIKGGQYTEVSGGVYYSASSWTVPFTTMSEPLGSCSLNIFLFPLKEGEYLIDKGYRTGIEIYSTARIVKDNFEKTYAPLKAPFKIQVDSLRFKGGSAIPYIEGKMEGILYNVKDLNDSIVVRDAVFGYH